MRFTIIHNNNNNNSCFLAGEFVLTCSCRYKCVQWLNAFNHQQYAYGVRQTLN